MLPPNQQQQQLQLQQQLEQQQQQQQQQLRQQLQQQPQSQPQQQTLHPQQSSMAQVLQQHHQLTSLLRAQAAQQMHVADGSQARMHLASALEHAARAVEALNPPEEGGYLVLSSARALLGAVLSPPPLLPQAALSRPVTRTHLFEVVYVNLRTRQDRRASIEEQLQLAGLQAARLEASTGADTPDSAVARTWDSTVNASFDTKTVGHPRVALSPGERGCAMSHRRLWEILSARQDDAPPVLILEDDAVLSVDFSARLIHLLAAVEATYADPSARRVLLYLCADVAKWVGPTFEVQPGIGLRQAEYLWQTAAYVMWAPAARALLALASPIHQPVDVFVAQATLDGHIASFVSQPALAQQALPFQNGDVLHSNFYKVLRSHGLITTPCHSQLLMYVRHPCHPCRHHHC